jgi:uncharacterized membrane protein
MIDTLTSFPRVFRLLSKALLFGAAALACAPKLVQAQIPPSAGSEPEEYAVLGNELTGEISSFLLDPIRGRAVTLIPPTSTVSTKLGISGMAVDQVHRFIYAVSPAAHASPINGFLIDADGQLHPLAGSPFSAGGGAADIIVAPGGRYVYLVNALSNTVSGFRIDGQSGRLTAVPGSPFPAGTKPSSLAIDPSSRFLYVANAGSNNVSAYAVSVATGSLSPISGSPFAAGTTPASVAVDPLLRFVYVANHTSKDVSGYTINETTGALTSVGSPFAAGNIGLNTVIVDSTGSFVYAGGDSGIFAYSITSVSHCFPCVSPGALSPLSGALYETFHFSKLAEDYTGTFLYGDDPTSGFDTFDIWTDGQPILHWGGGVDPGNGPFVIVRPQNSAIFTAVQIPDPPDAVGPPTRFLPTALNQSGKVAGSIVYGGSNETFEYAFRYRSGSTIGLGALGGGHVSLANDLNDAGAVVGTASLAPPSSFSPPTQAFLFDTGGLVNLDGQSGRRSIANGINNTGQVTGSLSTANACPPNQCALGDTHAFLSDSIGLRDLGTLGGDFSVGYGINNPGAITGGSNIVKGGPTHLMLFTNGKMHDLGKFNGFSTTGTRINDHGTIIGYAIRRTGSYVGFVYQNGAYQQLPGIPEWKYSVPSGLNNLGTIVGTSNTYFLPLGIESPPTPNTRRFTHAFVSIGGNMYDLNRLVDPYSPLFTTATGVNDKGQIVVTGSDNKAYLLTPTQKLN